MGFLLVSNMVIFIYVDPISSSSSPPILFPSSRLGIVDLSISSCCFETINSFFFFPPSPVPHSRRILFPRSLITSFLLTSFPWSSIPPSLVPIFPQEPVEDEKTNNNNNNNNNNNKQQQLMYC